MAKLKEGKPSWSDAPEWAKYLAMDSDGEWWWFERKPARMIDSWHPQGFVNKSRFVRAGKKSSSWKKSLEKRPAKAK